MWYVLRFRVGRILVVMVRPTWGTFLKILLPGLHLWIALFIQQLVYTGPWALDFLKASQVIKTCSQCLDCWAPSQWICLLAEYFKHGSEVITFLPRKDFSGVCVETQWKAQTGFRKTDWNLSTERMIHRPVVLAPLVSKTESQDISCSTAEWELAF